MNLFSNIKGDLYGGLTAAVVALPLALAFGVASGAGPLAGLYGAIALGFFAAILGGTPSQISGPTGPITVVAAAIFAAYQGYPALAFTVVILSGLFQILFGVMKLGHYITYMPYPVISGFMSGIGVIIIILQLAPLLGYDGTGDLLHLLKTLPDEITHPQIQALAIGLFSLSIMMFLPKKMRRAVPPPLATLVLGTMLGVFLLPGAPVLGPVPAGLPDIKVPALSWPDLPKMLSFAIMLAMLGSIDSLLTSLVADNYTRTQHRSDRELIGQGIGNIVAGLIGGLPGSGATMRTVVNIRAGGRTPLSGQIHAIFLLACLLGLGFLVEDIPRAVLAGILIKVGWDIIDWPFLRRLFGAGLKGADRQAVIVMFTVFILTVFVDLITAVAIGVIMESLVTARRLATHQIDDVQFLSAGGKSGVRHALGAREQKILDAADGRILLLRFTGPLSFGTARDLSSRLHHIYDSYRSTVIDLTDSRMMDVSIMMTLADMIEEMTQRGCPVFISGTTNPVFKALKSHGILKTVPAGHCFEKRVDALRQAEQSLA
ncbi:MAG: SulP family inorganic anion transporter [Rhodospirillales bacterium]|nr:SulP family inorganic anion transporter [Rhodospirillales bacterium]MCB9997042.1 SulP family inorganic anion transporter [Rhodospirillales bacterium]